MNNALHNHDCPPLMSDGRHATDYRPSCDVHDLIIKQNAVPNSHELRMFLQRNAEQLMSLNTRYFVTKNQCQSCQPFHVDPNRSDEYWSKYQSYIGYNSLKN